jgi:midasin
MRQPVVGWLQPELAGDAESKPLVESAAVTVPRELPSFPDEPSIGSLPNHFVNLSQTFRKFNTLIDGRIRAFIKSRTAHKVESLAIDIILTAKMLSTMPVSNTGSPNKEKQQKALLVRKRKAWSDLLKELKHGGFAVNMKPDILDQQNDVRWIREQPIISHLPTAFAHVERSEIYFTRLQGSLPDLRKLVPDHHPDITTRELQRGVTLLESGFSMALDMRSWCELPFSLSLLIPIRPS